MSMSSGQGSGQDVELNITPIIDCFTVLVTFMLASSAFLSIGIFDTAPEIAGAATSQVDEKPKLELQLLVEADGGFRLEWSGASKGKQNFVGAADLLLKLKELKSVAGNNPNLVLSGDDSVAYEKLIETMAFARKEGFGVLLGGLQ